ncbi:glycosyltransferase family 4 protein [Candidatus Woesearchaeota archaeon]|nr:glycosyltransferase family 4 protein [Candidatus Woesearchaeota archaeon]
MKFVEIVLEYPLRFPLTFKEDYFNWPARLMLEKGFGVEMLTLQAGGSDSVSGIKVRRFGSTLALLRHVSRDRDVRLIHSHLRPYPPSFFSAFVGKPKVLTPHTYILGSNPFVAWLSVRVMRRFDRVIALTPYEEKVYLDAGLGRDRVVLLPHPVDHEFFSGRVDVRKVREKYDVGEHEFVVTTVSNIRKCKRVDTILRAFRAFSRRVPSRLFVVGEDLLWTEREKSVKSMVAGLGLDNVVQTGFLEPGLLREVLAISDVFVNSSEVEAQGLSVYEAAAAGVPLCLSSIGSLRSVFRGLALYHMPSDWQGLEHNLLSLWRDSSGRKLMGRKLKEFVKAWDYAGIRKRMESLYSGVMGV